MSYFKRNRLSNATVRPKFFLSFIYNNSNIQAAHKLFFFSFHRIICQWFVLDADFAPVDILANVAANVPALLLLHWTACGQYLFQTDLAKGRLPCNQDTFVLRIISNYLSWNVPANFFRHSGRLLCTDWNLDLSALIRCHLFLKDFQQLMAPAPLMVSLTVRIPLFINRILQLEMYCPAPGCQSDCQQTFLHLWLVTGRQTFLATFFWMSRQTCAESFVNLFFIENLGST